MKDYYLEHRCKFFKLTAAAYDRLTNDLLVDVESTAIHIIDLLIDNEIDFSDLHLYLKVTTDKNYILNFMALG